MVVEDEVIVLRTLKYGDNKLVVHAFGRETGRTAIIAYGMKGGRKTPMARITVPMAHLRVAIKDGKGEMGRLVRAEMAKTRPDIYTDDDKRAVALFLADILWHSLGQQQGSSDLFDWLSRSLDLLDTTKHGVANIHLAIMWQLMGKLGFAPCMDGYEEGSRFDLMEGRFITDRVSAGTSSLEEAAWLYKVGRRITLANCHLIRLSGEERRRAIDRFIEYMSIHIPGFPRELETLKVLRETYR